MGNIPLVLTVNGERRKLEASLDRTLLDVLRDDLDLTGTKRACDGGECGSCAVLMGSKGLMSCLLPARRAQGKEIITIEGLASAYHKSLNGSNIPSNLLHPLQEAFIEVGASQCGFCVPGFIMEAAAILKRNPSPTREDVVKRLSRNICRCTGYVKIIDAVLYATELMRGGARRERSSNGNGRIVGQRVLRLDDIRNVTGEAKNTADLKMEGMLHVKVLRSPHHHANIAGIDTSGAEAMRGVEAVVTAKDIPGTPAMPESKPQRFLFSQDKVRFKGEAVAAVAAISEEIAAQALNKIKVDYQPLPAILDPLDAKRDDLPLINPPEPNIVLAKRVTRGDVEKGVAEADIIVENTYKTPRHEHFYMEPEAGLAYLDEAGRLVLKFPSHVMYQAPNFLSSLLNMDLDKVHVICPTMGGNFGGREDFELAGIVGLLAVKTRKPVRLVYTREESLISSSKWFSYQMRYKTGATKDGRITALDIEAIGDGGCWSHDPGNAVNDIFVRYTNVATGPYRIPNVRIVTYEATTNSPRSIPMRGVGSVPSSLAQETQIELIAEKLGIDPLEIRLRNALQVGDYIHTGQVLKESVGTKATLEALRGPIREAKAQAATSPPPYPWKRGIGIACSWRSVGTSGEHGLHKTREQGDVADAAAEILDDGRINVMTGAVEKGQSSTTTMAQIAAEALGVPLESMTITMGDTDLTPYPHGTFAQGTVLLQGGAVLDSARKLKEALIQEGAKILEDLPQNMAIRGGFIYSQRTPQDKLPLSRLAAHFKESGRSTKYVGQFQWPHSKVLDQDGGKPTYSKITDVLSYNSGLVEIDVNVETGQVRVLKITYAADTGTVINPHSYEGICHGGLVFGLGLALKERYMPGETRTIKGYGLATTKDAPEEITVIPVGEPYSKGLFGAKGGGEMSDIPPVPAILNAIADATGARLFEIPATPDKILEALGKNKC